MCIRDRHRYVRYKPSENWSSGKLRKGKCMKKGQNVYKRKDGRWEARIITGRTAEGKILYKSFYAPTCCQALQRKKDYEIEMVIHPPVTEEMCIRDRCPSVLKLFQLQLRANRGTVQIKNIPMPEVVDLKAAGYIKSQLHGIAVD